MFLGTVLDIVTLGLLRMNPNATLGIKGFGAASSRLSFSNYTLLSRTKVCNLLYWGNDIRDTVTEAGRYGRMRMGTYVNSFVCINRVGH